MQNQAPKHGKLLVRGQTAWVEFKRAKNTINNRGHEEV